MSSKILGARGSRGRQGEGLRDHDPSPALVTLRSIRVIGVLTSAVSRPRQLVVTVDGQVTAGS